MRPISLKVKGFTSFRDESEVRFEELGLFAIWGPTGSGKSSLLDAMTYALYGTVERVGNQVGQLISHGAARLTVVLEFAVGDDRYRVSRSTPRSGATKILLERASGDGPDDWEQAGDGADRVREVNKKVALLLGLDYEAFTRSILLPQGKFAEFLVGEAKERRDILTDLLGLELFGRMAKKAGEIAKDAKLRAEAMAEIIQREYAGVTPEAVAAAEETIVTATAQRDAVAATSDAIKEIQERHNELSRSVAGVRRLAESARALASTTASLTREVGALTTSLADLDTEVAAAVEAARLAREAHHTAAEALKDAERLVGSTSALAVALSKAESLPSLRKALEDLLAQQTRIAETEPALLARLNEADAAFTKAAADAEAVATTLTAAREAWEIAQQEDRVATICSGLHEGDACPVCGTTLTTVPVAPEMKEKLVALKAEGTRLADASKAADATIAERQRARDRIESELETARREASTIAERIVAARDAFASTEAELLGVFDGAVPADAAARLRDHIDTLNNLQTQERAAADRARAAGDGVSAAERKGTESRTALAVAHAKLGDLPIAAIFDRVRDELGAAFDAGEPPTPVTDTETGSVAMKRFASLAASLDAYADDQAEGSRTLLVQARSTIGDLLPPQSSFGELVRALNDLRTASISAVAVAEQSAASMKDRLANSREMADEAEALGSKGDRFSNLAQQLRADRLIAFLQSEALQLLCDAASDHLAALSDGRYRIISVDDEFMVVDTWNGEETRSVRTLSGGETFMASLSLALALSEQVQSLSVTQQARLESLFLDEGFGTLDSESLQEVLDALTQLGGDGRLTGVITHITELADQLPSKLMVTKSPRGSTVSISQ